MEENMEDFVVEAKKNTGRTIEHGADKDSRYRELIQHLMKYQPEVSEIKRCDKSGDVTFSVPMKELGLTFDTFMKYREEIFSDYIPNVLGELLVRENINKFYKKLSGIQAKKYDYVVNRFEHKQFGMHVEKSKFIFCFHISLLQSILTKTFERKISKKEA